jgi:hypothetical protein
MVKLIMPNKVDARGEVYIRWTTRARSPDTKSKREAVPPGTNPRKRQDSSACFIGVEPHASGDGADKGSADDNKGDDDEEEDACAVCLARAPDCELRPCGHARFCRRCVVETVCTWRQEGPPRCALCRAPFDEMVFLE